MSSRHITIEDNERDGLASLEQHIQTLEAHIQTLVRQHVTVASLEQHIQTLEAHIQTLDMRQQVTVASLEQRIQTLGSTKLERKWVWREVLKKNTGARACSTSGPPLMWQLRDQTTGIEWDQKLHGDVPESHHQPKKKPGCAPHTYTQPTYR